MFRVLIQWFLIWLEFDLKMENTMVNTHLTLAEYCKMSACHRGTIGIQLCANLYKMDEALSRPGIGCMTTRPRVCNMDAYSAKDHPGGQRKCLMLHSWYLPKMILMCSSRHARWNKFNYTMMAPFAAILTHLSMSFISSADQTADNAGQLKTK